MTRTMRPEVLRPLRFPLRGSRLIEASAGTGKTFTIAALYLRLVLGHGGDAAFGRPLSPRDILVVTFTEAATQELRDRIRARLAEAADVFSADPDAVHDDGNLLHALRADYAPDRWPACARALRLAAEAMDEAAVSTIHGWCNRMLREHAFDSGALFTQTLEADAGDLFAEAVRDYWRSFFAPLPLAQATAVRAWWPDPQALGATVGRLLPVRDALPEGQPPGQALRESIDERARVLAALKAPWRAWVAELQAWLDDAVANKQVDARRLQPRYYQPWLDGLRQWAEGDAQEPFDGKSTGWMRLTPQGLAEVCKPGVTPPDHPALNAMCSLRAQIDALPDGLQPLLAHATRWIAARLAAEQARRAQMGFDDLLAQLDTALRGPNGERLAALIRQQFPVALIDEFQDTDPLQYRIFDAVYRVADDDPRTAVVLIGDPKQAIYAFRGADIHTYLAARADTQGRHATLGTNFRSSQPMVAAVNHVFAQAEARPDGAGAFLFRAPDGDNPLPFFAVDAKGRAEHWQRNGARVPALTCWFLEGEGDAARPPGRDDAQRRLAASCATEIVALLSESQQGRTGFADAAGALRPVTTGDIAVLVNNGGEARAVREALAARGVRSVYLSDKGSVFQSPVAPDLQRWLAACAEPDDDRLLRAALGTATLGLSWAELDRLNHDELHWEDRVLQFRRYQQIWRRQGVLPMLRHLLHDFRVPTRLLAQGQAGGERALTDLLHLAELLQIESHQIDGEHALLRHLAEALAGDGGDAEARRLRLESDADLVKVVTVHKSKGLEYPLVFLPFATAFRPARADDLPLKWHDDAGHARVSLVADADALARADRERLGEDLRKLYVALTRARFATWIGAAPLVEVERSALGYLLGGGQPLSATGLRDALRALADGGPRGALGVQPAPEPSGEIYRAANAEPRWLPEPPLPQGVREPWWIASYTALRARGDGRVIGIDEDAVADGPAEAPGAAASAAEDTYAEESAQADTAADVLPIDDDAPARAAPPAGQLALRLDADVSLHGFARGATPGSFLHALLEAAGREGFARAQADGAVRARLDELIDRGCQQAGWDEWVPVLRDWLQGWLTTPLRLDALVPGASPVAPAQLQVMQVEMEFWLSATRVDAAALDALVCRHTLGGAPRAALAPQQVNGMLKGFIDLVFEHEGRYYVADYKSNWIGGDDAAYTPEALRVAVLHHRYELQYVLYVFALHRLLRARLPGYDYDLHVGGAVYLFLRGHAAPGQGLHLERPPRVLIDALDALFMGGGATA
ncbi:MAG: exodeoxyribonuclease V subunit beta [Burkholderiales bacterium]|nr:exodeoxyribonuclease V subunit beta [Burkholderiales bacterium]